MRVLQSIAHQPGHRVEPFLCVFLLYGDLMEAAGTAGSRAAAPAAASFPDSAAGYRLCFEVSENVGPPAWKISYTSCCSQEACHARPQ